MTGILHQQATSRCRDEISRNGKVGLGPYDHLKKIETVFPLTSYPGPHQLPIKVSSSKARCFRSSVEVGNQTESIRDRVSASTSDQGISPGRFHHRIFPQT